MSNKKTSEITIHSSAAEYLTFVAASGEGGVEAVYADENVWLTQKMMGELYHVETNTINYHLKKIFADSELTEEAVIRKFRTTAAATKRFFAAVQNKMHYAIHGQTAAEVIVERADAEKTHMGLTSWKDAPKGKIQKFDVAIAKNYLTEFELGQLERMVSSYLDFAETMARRSIPMTMEDWETRLNGFIELFDYGLLSDAGKVTAEIAKLHAETEFEKYRIVQDRLFESDFDRLMLKAAALFKEQNKQGADE